MTPPDDGGSGPTLILDEPFDDTSALDQWVDLDPTKTSLLTVTQGGELLMLPSAQPGNAWYEANTGPGIARTIPNGNFVVQARLSAAADGDPTSPPSEAVHDQATTVLLRNPALNNRWISARIGRLNGLPEAYSVPPPSGWDLASQAPLGTGAAVTTGGPTSLHFEANGSSHVGQVAICKIEQSFRVFRKYEGEDAWTELQDSPFSLPEMTTGDELELILGAESWTELSSFEARFDRVVVAPVATVDDCTTDY